MSPRSPTAERRWRRRRPARHARRAARQRHSAATAALCTRVEPDGERLGLPARQQAQPARPGQLRSGRHRLQERPELPHRRPNTAHLHRHQNVGMGQCLGQLV